MKQRIDDIEVLRALAVLLVVVHHAYHNLIPWSTPILDRAFSYYGGWSGVDLFFTISGFVIARSLIPKLESCQSREEFFKQTLIFWIRRFWRLIPSAWLWLSVILICCVFFNSSGAFGSFRANFEGSISAILQVANLHFAMIFGSPDGAGATFHYWSLSLEEQFYIMLPLLVLLTGRWLPYALATLIIYQLLSPRATLLSMTLRTDAILLGVMIALWARHSSYQLFEPLFLRNSAFARGLLYIVFIGSLASIGSKHLTIIEHKVGLIAIISAVLVFVASFDRDYLLPSRYLRPILLWIGSRSYALYLIHIPIYYLTREIWFRILPPETSNFGPEYTLHFVLTASVLLVIFSELNYRLIEMPLRKKGASLSREYHNSHADINSTETK